MLGESLVKLYSSEVLFLSVKCGAISITPQKQNAGRNFWNFCTCLVWNACSGHFAQGRVFYTAMKKGCGITSPLHKVPQQVMVRTSGGCCTLCDLDSMMLVGVQGITSEKQGWSSFLNSCRCAFLIISQLCELSTECHSTPASNLWHWNAAKILIEVELTTTSTADSRSAY